jgi:hypothetical protein
MGIVYCEQKPTCSVNAASFSKNWTTQYANYKREIENMFWFQTFNYKNAGIIKMCEPTARASMF